MAEPLRSARHDGFLEKTEKATPKKRKDTRKKGEVLQSKEVAVAVFVVGIFAFLAIFGNYMFQMLLNFMEQSMSSIDKTGNTVEFAMSVFWKVAIICICTVGPILAVGVVLSVLPVIVQTKGLFSMEAMKPKFSRLNPFTGIKRLFSMQALVGLVKGLIEIIVVVAILYFQVMDRINEFKKLIDTDVIKIVAYISETAMSLIVTIFVMLVFVAAADYVITKAGWGTVAECLLAQKPMALFARDSVLEDRTTIRLLEQKKLAIKVTYEQLTEMSDLLEQMKQITYPAVPELFQSC